MYVVMVGMWFLGENCIVINGSGFVGISNVSIIVVVCVLWLLFGYVVNLNDGIIFVFMLDLIIGMFMVIGVLVFVG